MTRALSIEDLTLVGTDESFYLDEGETFRSAHLAPDGAVLVWIDTNDGPLAVLAGLSTTKES